MQLAKFSEDTLSSYTEAVSSQVPSPGWMLALYSQPELSQAPCGTPGCPCIMALSFPLRAPLAPPSHLSNVSLLGGGGAHTFPGPFPLSVPKAISRETWPSALSLPPGDAALHLGPLPAGDPGDVAHTEPQLQPAPQPGLRDGEGGPGEGPASAGGDREGPASAGGSPELPTAWGTPRPLPCRHLPLQVLCCVDKQGILSWPNPSPETVLFFSGKVEPAHGSHEDLTDDLSTRSFCHPEVEEEVRPGPGRWPPRGGGWGEGWREEEEEGSGLRSARRGDGPRGAVAGPASWPEAMSGLESKACAPCSLQPHERDALLAGSLNAPLHLSNEQERGSNWPGDGPKAPETHPHHRVHGRSKHLSGSSVSFSRDTEGGEDDDPGKVRGARGVATSFILASFAGGGRRGAAQPGQVEPGAQTSWPLFSAPEVLRKVGPTPFSGFGRWW